MNTRTTVTIGIPAHNEAANILQLLNSVLSQTHATFQLEKIIVSSDGSTDQTASLVKKFAKKHPVVTLVDNRTRGGVARGLNQILRRSKSDIFVLLNADILLRDVRCIEKLIAPIQHGTADLTAAAIRECYSTTFFEKSLEVSMQLKNVLFLGLGNGNNLYTCHGPARAFSRRLYADLTFPPTAGDDMYSYFSCISRGFRFQYVKQAVVWYQLPKTMDDYLLQSMRFYQSLPTYIHVFGTSLVEKETRIGLRAYATASLRSLPILCMHPAHVMYYLWIQLHARLSQSNRITQPNSDAWKIAVSSKRLRIE
jgi:glycosyltransferase involved in cell wall biosynthesis